MQPSETSDLSTSFAACRHGFQADQAWAIERSVLRVRFTLSLAVVGGLQR